jgi:PAS domain S-box-containing protein
MPVALIFTAEDCDARVPEQEMTTALETGRSLDERWHVRKDGSRFWASGTVTPLKEEETGFVKILRDLTVKKRIQDALEQSERRNRLATEAAQLGTWELDLATGEQTCSAICKANFGLSADVDLTHEAVMEALDPEDRARLQAAGAQALASRERFEIEYRITWPDGSRHWIYGSGIGVYDDSGQPVRMVGITRNITQTKRTEIELRQQLELIRGFSESAIEAMFVLDFEGRTTFMNPAAEKMFGYRQEELLGRVLHDTLHYKHPDGTPYPLQDCPLGRVFRYGDALKAHEDVFFRKDGSAIPVECSNGPIFRDGRVAGAALIVHDITKRKETEAQRVALLEQVQALNADLEERVELRTTELRAAVEELEGFTYSVSHDLRAPLRAIVSTSRILLQDFADVLPPEARQQLDRQAAAASKLGVLIDELLKLSRISKVQLSRETVDLSQVAKEVVVDIPARSPSVTFEIQGGLAAKGDARLLRLVLVNLLENAAKFSPAGGMVRVGQRADGTFFVQDEGIGFDMQYAPKLFLPFERLVLDSEFPGTGIGLANVQRIITRHGGRIWAESSPGKGATFYFTLP